MGGSKGENQTQMQIIGHLPINRQDIGQIDIFCLGDRAFRNHGTEDHGKDVHQNHAGKIEHIEFQSAHTQFYMPAQHIEKVEEDQFQKTVARLGEYIGDQPPDLTLKNFAFVKAQQFIKNAAAVDHGHENDDGITQGNVQHQVGNALITVAQAKPIKTGA